MCRDCERSEPYECSAWFNHIWQLRTLQQAGYPFAADDLTLEEWHGLAEMAAALNAPPEDSDNGQ